MQLNDCSSSLASQMNESKDDYKEKDNAKRSQFNRNLNTQDNDHNDTQTPSET